MSSSKTFPATSWAAITPSDTAGLQKLPASVFVGVGGTVTVKGSDGTSALFTAVSGQILPIQPTFVMATGTAATGLVALYN